MQRIIKSLFATKEVHGALKRKKEKITKQGGDKTRFKNGCTIEGS